MGWFTEWRRRRVLARHRIDDALWQAATAPLKFLPRAPKLRQLALYYLKIRPYRGPVRFDVVGLTVTDGRLVRVDHIKNAID